MLRLVISLTAAHEWRSTKTYLARHLLLFQREVLLVGPELVDAARYFLLQGCDFCSDPVDASPRRVAQYFQPIVAMMPMNSAIR
jgi:hypothetical protein